MKDIRGMNMFRRPGRTAALLLLACCTCAVYVVVAACTDIRQPYFIVYMSAMIAFMMFRGSAEKEPKKNGKMECRSEKTHENNPAYLRTVYFDH
jgi:hypothetical protein